MSTVSSDSVAQDQIKAFVERIERLEEERKAIAGDIAEVYAEAKGNGFDRKALKTVVRIRAMDHDARMEQEALVELYLSALGMATAPADYDDFYEAPRAGARAPARAHVENIDEFAAGKAGKREPQAATPAQTVPAKPAPEASAERASVESSTTNPVANVEEEANGAIAAASDDPASREVDVADRQRLTASGFSGEAADVSQDTPWDECDLPKGGASAAQLDPVSISSLAVVTVEAGRESATDPGALSAARLDRSKPHPDCQDPEDCGLASWTHMCGSCLRARAAKAASVALQ